MSANLANINLFVRDVPFSVRFYQEVVGLTVNAERSVLPDFALLSGADENGATLTLQSAGVTPGAATGPSNSVEIGFAVDDVEAARSRLAAFEDLRFSSEPVQQMGWGTAWDTRDPDDHRITLYKLRS